MVAKSYQTLEQIGEPYISNGRMYVQVKTKKGTAKQVRWYSEAEYAKMYPNNVVPEQKRLKTPKEVLGFDKGYITIFKGNTYEDKEYFQLSKARYNVMWGWYFVSTEELPDDIPDDVEAIRLPWESVGNEDGFLKNESEIAEAVESLIYDEDISEYQGYIGERIELIVIVAFPHFMAMQHVYTVYLIVMVVATYVSEIWCARLAKKMYPYAFEGASISREEKHY